MTRPLTEQKDPSIDKFSEASETLQVLCPCNKALASWPDSVSTARWSRQYTAGVLLAVGASERLKPKAERKGLNGRAFFYYLRVKEGAIIPIL